MSSFDIIYRRMINNPFFAKGWGSPDLILQLLETVPRVSSKKSMESSSQLSGPIKILKEEIHKNIRLIEGSFISPLNSVIPGALEGTNRLSQFQMIVPIDWKTEQRPICFHFSGTGDQNYARRRIFLANKLLEDGIGSLIIMNPFYSERKPLSQKGSSLNYLTDLFVMGGALMTETNALLRWCDLHGYGPYALHGISMGGFMASLCSQASHRPISLIPCLSATTASCVFVDGVLAKSVDWPTLTKQYYDDTVFSKIIRSELEPSVQDKYKVSTTASDQLEIEQRLLKNEKAIREEILEDASKISTGDNSTTSAAPIDVSTWRMLDVTRLWSSLPSPASGWGLDYSYWLSVLRQDDPHFQSSIDPEVKQFMREMLDKFTHLGNFPELLHPSLVVAVLAEWDAYVPSSGVVPLNGVYPGAELRYLSQAGHVGAYLRNALWTYDFRDAICDSLNRQVELINKAKGVHEKGSFGIKRRSQESGEHRKKAERQKMMGITFPFSVNRKKSFGVDKRFISPASIRPQPMNPTISQRVHESEQRQVAPRTERSNSDN